MKLHNPSYHILDLLATLDDGTFPVELTRDELMREHDLTTYNKPADSMLAVKIWYANVPGLQSLCAQ